MHKINRTRDNALKILQVKQSKDSDSINAKQVWLQQLEREKELIEETKRIRREKQQLKLKQLYAKLRQFEQKREENLNEKETNKQLAIESKAR